MTLTTNLSLGELGEAMAPKSAKSFPGRNRPRENTRNCEIRCRDDPGKYIAKISATEGRFQAWVESESESRAPRRVPGAARRGAAPGGLLASLELLSVSTRAWNFPNFAETLKSKILLTFVMFSYHNSYLFLFCSCRCLKLDCNMLFMSPCIYHAHIHIDRITCHVMFESLSIHNLRLVPSKLLILIAPDQYTS